MEQLPLFTMRVDNFVAGKRGHAGMIEIVWLDGDGDVFDVFNVRELDIFDYVGWEGIYGV